MTFARELWYTAGWSEDIGRDLVARTIVGDHLVLFRQLSGIIAVLSDTCPHRFAPLHLGSLADDVIQCGYHGLRFDSGGTCIHNPHGNGATPKAARLRHYPAVEFDGIVWVWMGKGEPANTSTIPRFPELHEKSYAFTGAHTMTMDLPIDLIVDNLLDLSHAAYLHPATLGAAQGTKDVTSVKKTGNRIQSDRLIPGAPPAFVFQATEAAGPDDIVDYWANMRWDPPGVFSMDAGIVVAGGRKEDGKILSSVQIVVPSIGDRSYYFWKMFRNYNENVPGMTAAIEAAVAQAFVTEDEPMIRAVKERMAGKDFWEMRPLLLPQDSAAVQARRIMDALVRDEAAGAREVRNVTEIPGEFENDNLEVGGL